MDNENEVSIREIPEGVAPLKYVAEEISKRDSKCNYSTLRRVCQKKGLTMYKFADMVLCVNREEANKAWDNKPSAGRPWPKKESK